VSSLLEEEPGADGHAEFHVNYEFECVQPGRFDGLELTLFERLPALQRVQLLWVLEHHQGAATLTPAQPRAAISAS
jgi:hypothetical protein